MREIRGEADLESVFMLARRVRGSASINAERRSILCTGEPAAADHVGGQHRASSGFRPWRANPRRLPEHRS